MDRSISSVARRRMTDMGTPLADFLTRAAVAASAPASAAASSALVPRRWPFRRGSMPRQADDARTLSRHRCCEWAHGTGAGTQLSSRAARPVGAIGPQLRIVAHFAPTGVAVFCHLFIGKITTSRRFRRRQAMASTGVGRAPVRRPLVKKRPSPVRGTQGGSCSSGVRRNK
jgi:hypothetical protein